LNIRDIDAQYTLGERAKKRQEIIKQLEGDEVFDMNRQLELPTVPQRVAVISSESAAGFGDFMDQLAGNEFGYQVHVQLFNSVMQGEKAEASIIASMHRVFRRVDDFDILVIIRGGGASLDLDCFDSYELGSHVAQFPIPVITGIGHERDETITDMVAHTKMKTPTAVAEFIISGIRNFEMELHERFSILARALNEAMNRESSFLDQFAFRFQRAAQRRLNEQQLVLNNWTRSLFFKSQDALKQQSQKLDHHQLSLSKNPKRMLERQLSGLEHFEKELTVLDPESVLKRGYSVTTIDGENINKLKAIDKNAKIITLTSTRKIESKYMSDDKRN
jgi:exodeoxyribonuclease VII large subunit